MTAVKLCGLTRIEDIDAVNEIKPEYIGFVFWPKSKRNLETETAILLKKRLDRNIKAVGVFVDAEISFVAELLNNNVIDMAQLHGHENDDYIRELKELTGKEIIKAFKIISEQDINTAEKCISDYVLLDAGMGDGKSFDWSMIGNMKRPYFLAGGLDCNNVLSALEKLKPYAVDVSSGIETNGHKDIEKMHRFVEIVRRQ